MRIYDTSLTGAAGPDAARLRETQEAGKSTASRSSAAAGAAEDHVELSASLGALARAVSTDRANRASRIQALTAQVENGTYRPDPHAISRGMVAEALAGGGNAS